MTKEEFKKVIKQARELIATWPEWKKGILEQSGKSTMSVPRKPILDPDKDCY